MRKLNGFLVVSPLTCLIALLGISGSAGATSFRVHAGKDSRVTFASKAAMEQFEGKTNSLEGEIDIDPAALGDSASVRFEVDLATLDTGLKMRNTHMRENHLETAKFPKAVFDGAALRGRSARALEAGRAESLDVEGTFTLHGVSRRIRIAVEIVYHPAPAPARIEFSTTFPVALGDYAIARPQFLFLKLADVQTVKVRGVALEAPEKITK